MKACREWQNIIVEYADGVCEPETAQRLEAHLALCPACARAVQAHQQVKQAIAQMDKQHAPVYLARRIRDHARSAIRRRNLARFTVRLSFSLTVAVAVIALWWNQARHPSSPTPPADESALAQAIVQEYIGTTAGSGFSDPSLQMLAREAQMKTVKMELMPR